MLLVHGDDDRNMPFQQTTDLVEKLQGQTVAIEELIRGFKKRSRETEMPPDVTM